MNCFSMAYRSRANCMQNKAWQIAALSTAIFLIESNIYFFSKYRFLPYYPYCAVILKLAFVLLGMHLLHLKSEPRKVSIKTHSIALLAVCSSLALFYGAIKLASAPNSGIIVNSILWLAILLMFASVLYLLLRKREALSHYFFPIAYLHTLISVCFNFMHFTGLIYLPVEPIDYASKLFLPTFFLYLATGIPITIFMKIQDRRNC